MANPFPGTTTMSSAGVSPAIMLDPTARVTAILAGITALGSSAAAGASDVTIQGTLDPWTPLGVSAQTWSNISTSHYSSASGGALITFTGPIAGLRLSSSSFTGASTITLKALQAITAGP